MGVVTATELIELAGKPPASSGEREHHASPAIPDEEALSNPYIPADGLSACLITPHRVLVTAGATISDRVLPFSVIRYLDLTRTPAWTKPLHLRRKRGSVDIPVPRVAHSLTFVPYDSRLYLFGGMKIDPDMGDICKTLFAFEPKNRRWTRVDTDAGRVKQEPSQVPGPRFAHSAVYVALRERGARPNSRAKDAPSLFVYGGYAVNGERVPRAEVHVLNIRTMKWSLHSAKGGLPAPHRANHAAAVTENQQYMVIHGGNSADDDEISVLSDELYVFDVLSSQWFMPRRHPSSALPPSSRRRHCLVNGVGRHEGWLIMYGGHLPDDGFSNDMFMCRIIEGSSSSNIGVVWERIDVRSVHRSLNERGSNALKRRTVSGGCLIAIPTRKKYILLGGRSQLGLREAPLLLDPSESDEIARDQSLPYEEDEEDEMPVVNERPTATNGGNEQDDRNDLIEDSDGDGDDIIFDIEKNAVTCVAAQHTQKIPSALSTPPGEKPSSARRLPSASVTPSEKSPIPSPPAEKTDEVISRRNPDTSVHRAVAVRLRLRSAEKKKTERGADEDDSMSSKKRGRADASSDGNTPPTKRGRFLRGEESDEILPLDFGDDDDLDEPIGQRNEGVSHHSEFVSASELARKGKMAARGGRRGRGRAVGSTRTRSVDDRAEEKRREALEKLNEKNEERIAYLEAENSDLYKQLNELKTDNLTLNDQHVQLLEQLRMAHMRETANLKDTAPVGSQVKQLNHLNGSHSASQMAQNGLPSSASSDVDSLRATVGELQAEIAKRATEKEGLLSNLKELEEEKRDVQKELCVVKNRVERTAIDRDSYHQEMKDLRKELVLMTKNKENAEKRTKNAEEELTVKKGEVDLLKSDFKVERQRRQDGKLELSTADRKVRVVQGQLAESRKQNDDMKAREAELKTKLEKLDAQVSFLQEQLDTSKTANRKLENEKIELSSKLETGRIELEQKVKQCAAAMKDGEKSREALERERLKHANNDAGGEHVRMRAELERTRKECASLRVRCERIGSLNELLPKIREIYESASAVFQEDKEDLDIAAALSQARRTSRANGTISRPNAGTGKQNNVSLFPGHETTQSNQGPASQEGRDKRIVDLTRGKELVEDSGAQIADSDDADTP